MRPRRGGRASSLFLRGCPASLHHLGHRFLQLALGVEEELSAGDHDVVFVQSLEHLDAAALALDAGLDVSRLEPAVPPIDEDELACAGIDIGLAWNQDRVLAEATREHHRGIHVRLELQRRVVKLQPHLDDSCLFLEIGIDVDHLAAEDVAGQIGQRHRRVLSHAHPRQLVFVDIHIHPDAREVGDRVEPHPRLDRHLLYRHLFGHDPRRRTAHQHGLGNRARRRQGVDLLVGNVEVLQLDAAGLHQATGVFDSVRKRAAFQFRQLAHGRNVLHLRRIQLGGIHVEQRLAFLDRLPRLVDVQLLDPSVELRIHKDHTLFVVVHPSERPDDLHQRATPDPLGAKPHVLDRDRIDPHRVAGDRVAGIGIDRHEVHPHRAFAGRVGNVVRVHRCPPVEDFSLFGTAGGRVARPARAHLHRRELHVALGTVSGFPLQHFRVHAARVPRLLAVGRRGRGSAGRRGGGPPAAPEPHTGADDRDRRHDVPPNRPASLPGSHDVTPVPGRRPRRCSRRRPLPGRRRSAPVEPACDSRGFETEAIFANCR